MILVGLLVFGGNETIERAFASWSGVLYMVYVLFFVGCLTVFGSEIRDSLTSGIIEGSWVLGGFQYAGYNLAVIPAVLITIRRHRNRRDTFISGLVTGPLAMLPAFLFFVAIAGEYAEIVGEAVPVNHMLELPGSRTFQIVFQVMLFGTLVETGAGMIHSVNERVAQAYGERSRGFPPRTRALLAIGILALGALIAQFGLTPLIAQGYGALTYGYLAVFVAPILTLGDVPDLARGRLRRLIAEIPAGRRGEPERHPEQFRQRE